jgi:hypothetical protein
MSRRSSARQRGRRTPERAGNPILAELGWSDLSWPVLGWSAALLALGFGPLLVATLIGVTGTSLKLLAALGPKLVFLAFAGLAWKYGMRYAPEMGRSKRQVWLLVAVFVARAGLVGWVLFVSV